MSRAALPPLGVRRLGDNGEDEVVAKAKLQGQAWGEEWEGLGRDSEGRLLGTFPYPYREGHDTETACIASVLY